MFFVEDKKNCPCCAGFVNMCQGEECSFLGICYCMVVDDDDVPEGITLMD